METSWKQWFISGYLFYCGIKQELQVNSLTIKIHTVYANCFICQRICDSVSSTLWPAHTSVTLYNQHSTSTLYFVGLARYGARSTTRYKDYQKLLEIFSKDIGIFSLQIHQWEDLSWMDSWLCTREIPQLGTNWFTIIIRNLWKETHVHNTLGTFRCGNCHFCTFINTTNNFSLPNREMYSAHHFFNCRAEGLMYLPSAAYVPGWELC